MKKVFTVAIASLVTLLSFAADNPRDGRLRISNLSRQDIVVYVDGRVIRDRDDHMLVGGLRPGNHEVRVYRVEGRGRRNRGSIFGGLANRLIYNSSVFVTPGSETRVIIDRGGQVYVDRQGGRGGRGGRDRDYDYGYGQDRDRNNGDRRDRDWRN
jgi:hypothetical protein